MNKNRIEGSGRVGNSAQDEDAQPSPGQGRGRSGVAFGKKDVLPRETSFSAFDITEEATTASNRGREKEESADDIVRNETSGKNNNSEVSHSGRSESVKPRSRQETFDG